MLGNVYLWLDFIDLALVLTMLKKCEKNAGSVIRTPPGANDEHLVFHVFYCSLSTS